MKIKVNFTPQKDFIDFVESFNISDPILDDLINKLTRYPTYEGEHRTSSEAVRAAYNQLDEYERIRSEILKLLLRKKPIEYLRKYPNYL